MEKQDKRIKCTACKRVKFEEDFLKNQKILKTCIGCRDKKKTEVKEPVKELVKELVKEYTPILPEVNTDIAHLSKELHIEPSKELPDLPVLPKVLPKDLPSRWIGLSGFWIQQGDELKLHKKLMRKLNRQFHQQCAFPVHKYLTRWVMVDIRDRYIG
jgi:hypothetical protein